MKLICVDIFVQIFLDVLEGVGREESKIVKKMGFQVQKDDNLNGDGRISEERLTFG